jgi:hypothetical protein
MSLSLAALEAERTLLLQQFLSLGDLRPGSISAVVRRCGKPSCHCAKPDDPGHDPQLRLTRKVNGKSVAESFFNPAAFEKAKREVDEFHRFQNLAEQLVAVNEKICSQRQVEPDPAGWTPQEKKRRLRSIARWRERSKRSSR